MTDRKRGQSEVVGFLLIFGLVVLAIALVGITAFTGLNNAQEYQETTSTEQAFLVLADNIDDTNREGAPSRNTEIGLSEAELTLDGTERIKVTVENGGTTIAESRNESQPIVYESRGDTSISYRSGLLVRNDAGNALSFREPQFVLTNESVVLPIVTTTAKSDRTIAGTSAVQVITRSTGTAVIAAENFDSAATVTINITSPQAEIWNEYLDGKEDTECTLTGDTVECEIDTSQVFVSVENVEVEVR